MNSPLMDLMSLARVICYGVLCVLMVVQGVFRVSAYRAQRLLLGGLFALLVVLTQNRPQSLIEDFFVPVWTLYTVMTILLASCTVWITWREIRVRRPYQD